MGVSIKYNTIQYAEANPKNPCRGVGASMGASARCNAGMLRPF